jgi:hypothetical protein
MDIGKVVAWSDELAPGTLDKQIPELFTRQTLIDKPCDVFLHLAKKIGVHLLQYYSNDDCERDDRITDVG